MFNPRESIVKSMIEGLITSADIDISELSLSKWAERFVDGNESHTSEDMEDLILSMLAEMCKLIKRED